ncbi:MAG TPA: glycoside hydrolase family 38 C-terminal domain-containing protein, partial [Candidatus Syntrophosphaera sp.]|nr:glycoside hydrolase family 38 C-terminal domain-containing protein [Candidatus Syntrophosphaera sp.]
RQQDLEGVCKFRFASAAEFFRHLGRQDLTGLPVAYGELYLEFHRGTYTTQAHTKTDNSRSEFNLGAAEFWAVLCRVKPYPEFLRELWRDTLLLQFHDILPGSSIHQVYQDACISSAYNCIGWQGFMSNLAQEAADQDLPKGCRACLILNACNQELVDWLEFPKVFLVKYLPQDDQGDTLPCLPAGDSALEVKVQVPAFSCRQIIFVPAATKPTPKTKRIKSVLENQCLRVRLTPTGGIASILDKRTGRELLAAESNLLQLWEDEPNNWGAWDINHFYRTTQPQGVGAAKLVAEKSIRLEGEFDRVVMNLEIGNSKLTQTVELRHGEPFIRFQHSVTWKEEHRMLRVHFHPDLHSAIATYGIQGGVIQRSTKPKNAWEEAQFEVPAQRFADLSQPDRGCALISGTKYGYRVRDNQMELNLLRSPADVDPEADLGHQSYAYAFYPHTGDYAKSDVFQVAEQFVNKLIRIDTKRLFTQVPEPFFSFTCDHVNLDTVKPAEEGAGIVLRFHEYKGQSGTAKLILKRPFKQVWLCNMLEEVITPLQPDATLSLDFRPFEIKTLLLLEES